MTPEEIAELRREAREGVAETLEREARRESVSGGARLIMWERLRQLEAEGWTPEHDDKHTEGELIDAAISYAMHEATDAPDGHDIYVWWPWDASYWKPSTDPVRNLVKAGALIAAEIDRLQRRGG